MNSLRYSFAIGASISAVLLGAADRASAQIDRPGNHIKYTAEVQPHLVIQWDDEPVWEDEGLGIGVHASFPVMDNGPVPTINNNLAITVGLDWAHFDDSCLWRYRFNGQLPNRVGDCSADNFWLPVAAQWNFFFSDLISAYMQLGLGIQHATWDVTAVCANGQLCDYDDSDTDVELVAWLGVRFHLGKAFALTLQLGKPSLLLGVSFFM